MHRTDELSRPTTTDEFQAQEQAAFTRYIDITITDVPHTQPPSTVESDLAQITQEEDATQTEEEREAVAPAPEMEASASLRPLHRPNKRCPVVLVHVCLMLFSLLGVGVWVALPIWTPGATITIEPISKQVRTEATLHLVTGQSQSTESQVRGRQLPQITMSQAETIPTTGKSHQEAQAAHGTITFYNAVTVAQPLAAGTLITGRDGIQVITDTDVSIPAASFPTFGQASVMAHATITGPAGNIAASDIYGPCCRLNMQAVNGPFHGGQDARTYNSVAAADLKAGTDHLTTSLEQSTQAALETQVHSDETLVTPLLCTTAIKADHQGGEEAVQVHITAEQTCTGYAVKATAYQSAIAQAINQQATNLGDGFTLLGNIRSQITKTTPTKQGLDMQTSITATYGYQFSQEQQQRLKVLIAGKSKTQARAILTTFPGVQSVSITIKNDNAILPTESTHIQLVFLMTAWSE